MTISNRRLAMTLVMGLAGSSGLAALLMLGQEASPALSAAAGPEQLAPEPEPMVGTYVPLSEALPRTATTGTIIYPDGNNFPALNDVQVPIEIIWTSGRPYSPIVGTMNDGPPLNLEWYVHANGSHSTTAMRSVQRGGPLRAIGLVRAPVNPLYQPGVSLGENIGREKNEVNR